MSRITKAFRKLKVVNNPFSSRKFVGEDMHGNMYWEVAAEGQEAPKRIVEPKDSVEVSDYNPATIPVQWRSWLTRGRDTPPTPEELLAHEKRSQLMAARVRQIEERLREQKLLKLEGTTAEAARAVLGAQTGQPAATTAPMEAPQAAAKSPAPERRPKGLDALNPEPSGSFEHFQPGAWKPAPAKRVK